VYLGLLKLGREKRYKIGKAVLVERRKDQISIQLHEDLELVHAITTDDAYGIEDYWHRRFAVRNTKGEWFSLSRQDVEAFKRRKFM
jgi:Meiotically up-regulated gene 113